MLVGQILKKQKSLVAKKELQKRTRKTVAKKTIHKKTKTMTVVVENVKTLLAIARL